MSIQLEDLEYQREAIDAVVDVLDGQVRNTFDNSNLFGIHANTSSLTPGQVEANKKAVLAKTGVSEADASLATETVDRFKGDKQTFFICFELALDTTKKWNLKHHLSDRLNAM